MQTHFSGSAYQAKAILGAWHSGDSSRLQLELDRVADIQGVDSGEQERLELLAEIARELRSEERIANDPLCDSLLEHLAFPQREVSRRRSLGCRANRRVSGYAQAAAATALQ